MSYLGVNKFMGKLLGCELTLHVPFFWSWFKRFTYIGAGVKNAIHVPPRLTKTKQAKAQAEARRNALISGVFDIFVKSGNLNLSMQFATTRRKRNVL